MNISHKIIINTDGASRGNPGHAAASFIIRSSAGDILKSQGKYLGWATNNEAEYMAVKLALECLKNNLTDIIPAEIEVRADSLLVASQLAGKYKIKNERLKVFYNQIKEVEKKIGSVIYTYIPRDQNIEADKLANLALDNKFS